MQPLLAELKKLPARLQALSTGVRIAIGAGAAGLLAVVALISALSGAGQPYQYVFTKLTPDDSAACADVLRGAGVPFRVEATGDAIAVPADKVHDARLLLASHQLPRAAGVGFEIFERSDLGQSELTQRVNLQRALEGELARTIKSLSKVRDARVHVTMPKRGLLRTDDKLASAAVMLTLEPGRSLTDDEAAGVRHLVSSAVPEVDATKVTIIDQSGNVVGDQPGSPASAIAAQQKVEHELETRIISLLEPAVGRGAVVARVTATMDMTEQDETESTFDPQRAALRSERKRTETSSSMDGTNSGLAGAAANQPLDTAPPGGNRQQQKQTNVSDETRNFEVSGVVTHKKTTVPRMSKLSVAVLVDGKGDKPRPPAEMQKLSELAKRAVGYDEDRGDQFEITSVPFSVEPPVAQPSAPTLIEQVPGGAPTLIAAAAAVGVLLAAAVAFVLVRRRKRQVDRDESGPAPVEKRMIPGTTVRALEAALAEEDAHNEARQRAHEKAMSLQERARRFAIAEPDRAVRVLTAWIEHEPVDDDSKDSKDGKDGKKDKSKSGKQESAHG